MSKAQSPKTYLYINTALDNIIEIAVIAKIGKIIGGMRKEVGFTEAEKLLPFIVSLLRRHNFSFKDLKGVFVAHGPGRFTSLRIGIATANTLAFSLKIPVLGIDLQENAIYVKFDKLAKKFKKGVYALPEYGREPNITKPKK